MISPGVAGASAGRLRSAPLARPKERPDASRENDHAPSARSSSVEVRGGVPIREIARRIGVAASTVRATIKRFQAAGLSWPLPEELTDAALEARLFADAGTKQGHRRQVEPDWASTHRE